MLETSAMVVVDKADNTTTRTSLAAHISGVEADKMKNEDIVQAPSYPVDEKLHGKCFQYHLLIPKSIGVRKFGLTPSRSMR